jgi:hypothetical protein
MSRNVLLLTLILPLAALAQTVAPLAPAEPGLDDLMHARDYAMGSAYRAHGLGAESVYGNPASLGVFKRYQVELSGAWDPGHDYLFGSVAVVDSSTSEVAGGLAYHLVRYGPPDARRTAHLNTLAIGFPISEAFYVGASGRHVLMGGGASGSGITMDAGLLIRPLPFLAISASGHNLVDIANPDVQRHYALSAAYLGGLLTITGEARGFLEAPENGGNRIAYSGGIEYLFGQSFPLRAGYSFDQTTGTQFLGAGIGLLTESGGFDLGYRHELNGTGKMFALTAKIQVR